MLLVCACYLIETKPLDLYWLSSVQIRVYVTKQVASNNVEQLQKETEILTPLDLGVAPPYL